MFSALFLQFLEEFGLEAERHLYRCLFSSLLATSPGDSTRITLLQALFTDLGPFFQKNNTLSLVQFAFNYSDSETPSSVSSKGNKGSGKDKGSLLRSASSSSLLHQVSEVSRLLKFSHGERLYILVCLNEHHSFSSNTSIRIVCESNSDSDLPSDCSIEDTFLVDLNHCHFATSDRHLAHFIITSLSSSSDALASKILCQIAKQFRSHDPIEDEIQLLLTPFLLDSKAKSNTNPCSVTMSTASASMSSLSEEQLAAMLISRSNNGILTSEQLKSARIAITPGLCAKLLFQLCANCGTITPTSVSANQGSTSRQPPDIDALANICREFLVNSASPLSDVIEELDASYFVPYNDRVINFKSVGKPFSRFWSFCMNLCNTEKQGKTTYLVYFCLLFVSFFSFL